MQGLVAFLITLAFSFFLEREDAPAETALAIEAMAAEPRIPSRVKVVRIDSADFHSSLFGARNPVDTTAIVEVIRAIAAARPAVIGIDIESSSSAYAALGDSVAGVPLVWARETRCPGKSRSTCEPHERIPQRAAGLDEPGPEQAGFIMHTLENNGSVQRYERVLKTARGTFPTFSTAVLERAGTPVDTSGGFRLIRYRRTTNPDSMFTARWVLDAARGDGAERLGVFRGRIVLLGGAFLEARDSHLTPLGELAGVELLAQILETELEGGGPPPPTTLQFFIIQFMAGLGIVAIFHFCRELKSAFLLALGLCVVATPVASLILFRTPGMWFYFLPAVCVWMIQQLYDEAKSYRDERLLGGGPAPAPRLAIDIVGKLPLPGGGHPAPAPEQHPTPAKPAANDKERKPGQTRKRRSKNKSRSRR
jgi:CHASE2 domain-containing sensor protein